MVLEKLKCIVKRELHDYIGLNEGCVEIDGACHIELASQVCLVSKIDNTLQRLNLADLWSHRHHHPNWDPHVFFLTSPNHRPKLIQYSLFPTMSPPLNSLLS